jgi:biotin carboxylase
VKTVLFVGAGRHQRRAILQAKELGLRVAAVDRNPDAPGLQDADIAKVVDFSDVEAVLKATRRLKVDGVLTVSADRAVPVVAAVAAARGLPGIGLETAHLMTHKVAMRRRLADAGVPQPRFAAVRTLSERRRAADEVGFPAVLKPADSGGQRGVFRVESLDDIDAHLHEALAASPSGEAILEEYVEGMEMNGIVLARGGESIPLTLSDRRRPPGVGFGVGWMHVYPATVFGHQLEESERVATHTVHALGLRTGIAFPQLIATPEGRVIVVECAARIPGGQMADLVRVATGVDLVDVQIKMALGDELPDELVHPQFKQPLAIRFFTAAPGPLPTGKVQRVGPLDKVLAFPGVVQADVYLQVGETIRPVQVDGDRRGYVIATADTNLEAIDRADAAAGLLDVEVEPS